MADLNKIDEKVVAHLESLDLKTDLFSDSVKILENKLSKQLSEYLSTFELDKGNLVLNNANISKLGALQVEIEKALKKIGYDKILEELLINFGDIDAFWKETHLEANGINIQAQQLNQIREYFAAQVIQTAGIKGIANGLQPLLSEVLRTSITAQTGLLDALKTMEAFVKSGAIQSPATRYILTHTKDVLNQYDGVVNQKIAEAYGLDGIRYVGSILTTSRAQCKRWVKMGTIPIKDLQKEIDWAAKYGSGQNPNTTPATFNIYRGGYGCRHSSYPIRL